MAEWQKLFAAKLTAPWLSQFLLRPLRRDPLSQFVIHQGQELLGCPRIAPFNLWQTAGNVVHGGEKRE